MLWAVLRRRWLRLTFHYFRVLGARFCDTCSAVRGPRRLSNTLTCTSTWRRHSADFPIEQSRHQHVVSTAFWTTQAIPSKILCLAIFPRLIGWGPPGSPRTAAGNQAKRRRTPSISYHFFGVVVVRRCRFSASGHSFRVSPIGWHYRCVASTLSSAGARTQAQYPCAHARAHAQSGPCIQTARAHTVALAQNQCWLAPPVFST